MIDISKITDMQLNQALRLQDSVMRDLLITEQPDGYIVSNGDGGAETFPNKDFAWEYVERQSVLALLKFLETMQAEKRHVDTLIPVDQEIHQNIQTTFIHDDTTGEMLWNVTGQEIKPEWAIVEIRGQIFVKMSSVRIKEKQMTYAHVIGDEEATENVTKALEVIRNNGRVKAVPLSEYIKAHVPWYVRLYNKIKGALR